MPEGEKKHKILASKLYACKVCKNRVCIVISEVTKHRESKLPKNPCLIKKKNSRFEYFCMLPSKIKGDWYE